MKKQTRLCVAAAATAALTLGSVPVPPAQAQPLPGLDREVLERVGVVAGLLAALGLLAFIGQNTGLSSFDAPALDEQLEPQRPVVPAGKRSITVAGVPRSYTVVRPAGWRPSKRYPVVLSFGGWQHTAEQARGYQTLEGETRDAIVVYAQGVENAWGGAPYAATSIQQDIDYVRAVLDDVAVHDSADPERVAAIGLSNGGGMAAALACHAPNMVDAVVSVAGAYYTPTVTNCVPGSVPTLLMHGTNDGVVGYGGGRRHGATYESVPDVFATFKAKNVCAVDTELTLGNVTTVTPACVTETKLTRIEGGGHTWFPANPNATREAMTFALRHL